MIKKYIKNKNILLNVRVYSETKSETIILLHGGPGIPDKMVEVVDILKNKFRIITFDQRGTGNSKCENCDFSIDSYISDINIIIDFFSIKSFHLFGYSWGGLYAQIYASKNYKKILSLFLCSSMPGTSEIWKEAEKEAITFNKKSSNFITLLSIAFYSVLGIFGNSFAYKKLYEKILENYTKNENNLQYNYNIFANISAKAINKTRKNALKYTEIKGLQNPDFPIFITYGDNDIYTKTQKFVFNKYPTAKRQIIENSGHTAWLQNPEKFREIITKFYDL